jgi:hypothetical protein
MFPTYKLIKILTNYLSLKNLLCSSCPINFSESDGDINESFKQFAFGSIFPSILVRQWINKKHKSYYTSPLPFKNPFFVYRNRINKPILASIPKIPRNLPKIGLGMAFAGFVLWKSNK